MALAAHDEILPLANTQLMGTGPEYLVPEPYTLIYVCKNVPDPLYSQNVHSSLQSYTILYINSSFSKDFPLFILFADNICVYRWIFAKRHRFLDFSAPVTFYIERYSRLGNKC